MRDYLRKNFRIAPFVFGLLLTAVLFTNSGVKTWLYKASILDLPAHAPFDGTVYPVDKVPDYTKLSEAERKLAFSELPKSKLIDVPYYDAAQLSVDSATLKWGDANDNKIRNAKITYSVPYMGNYKLDGHEHAGSHLAVDIKVPMRTPVKVIANGTVTKVSNVDSGFGKHVVVMHKGVPDPRRKGKTTTLYSSYSHNDENLVAVGDVVKKGEVVAYSGRTGTSTTPHIHFQLDNADAPWHPFWAFTWKEASDAGLDFTTAINAGLGKEKALQVTEHPMKFVQDHLSGRNIVVEVEEEEEEEEEEQKEVVEVQPTEDVNSPEAESFVDEDIAVEEEEEVIVEEPVVAEEADPRVFGGFEIEVQDQYVVGKNGEFTVKVVDQYGELYEDEFRGNISVKSMDGKASAKAAILSASDFENGVNRNTFRRLVDGEDRLLVEYEGEEYRSASFEIYDPESRLFTDVSKDHKNYKALKFLKDKGVIRGYEDGSAKPNKVVSRAEAAKIIVDALDLPLEDTEEWSFPDGSKDDWYGVYVSTLKKRGVINGDGEGRLLAHKEVAGSEMLKMILTAMEVDLPSEESTPWFKKYLDKARDLDLIDKGFKAEDGMTRGEVAEVVYRIMNR